MRKDIYTLCERYDRACYVSVLASLLHSSLLHSSPLFSIPLLSSTVQSCPPSPVLSLLFSPLLSSPLELNQLNNIVSSPSPLPPSPLISTHLLTSPLHSSPPLSSLLLSPPLFSIPPYSSPHLSFPQVYHTFQLTIVLHPPTQVSKYPSIQVRLKPVNSKL